MCVDMFVREAARVCMCVCVCACVGSGDKGGKKDLVIFC